MGSRKRMNAEGDRLSSLPDDLIHKILSFVSIKQAVQISVLSSRWRFIWTSMPYLNFSSKDFLELFRFSDFVKHVLSGRNKQIEVSSVDLTFWGRINQAFVKRILDYAFAQNVKQLNITCLYAKMIDSALSLFSSQSLKHLTLTGCINYNHSINKLSITTPPTWELPALATLNLHHVTLYDKGADLFSHCANLKNLTIKNCTLRCLDASNFNIRHLGLSSLTLEDGYKGVNVVTPHLKNLIIKGWQGVHLISAPNLSFLNYKHDYCSLELSADLLYLEKVDICTCGSDHEIVCLLQQLHSVKFLTLSSEVIKLLSSSVELISHQPSPFTNLKSLKIYPKYVSPVEQTQRNVTMSPEVKKYLLGGSPGATFTIVSHEEIRAVKNVTSTRNLMGKLQVLLDQWKENYETDKVPIKHDMALMESHMATMHEQGEVENQRSQRDTQMKCCFHERITRIESYWEDLNKAFQKGYNDTRSTISMLREIEELLKRVPRSHGAKLQAKFYGLRAEAESLMKKMIDKTMIQCDKKPNFFHELTTSSQLSF